MRRRPPGHGGVIAYDIGLLSRTRKTISRYIVICQAIFLGDHTNLDPARWTGAASGGSVANEWTINYLPSDGGRLTGKLTVATEDVRFTALYDSSNSEIIKGIAGSLGAFAASGGHVAYIHDTATEFEIVLPRIEITSAVQAKKGMMKRAIVTMADGSEFVFDYGMLSTRKLVAVING